MRRRIERELISTIAELKPHLILLDIFGGDDKALQMLAKIRSDQRINKSLVIACINKDDICSKEKFIALGVNDYVEVGFYDSELMLKIKNQLEIFNMRYNIDLSRKALEESLHTIKDQKKELENNLALAAKIQESLIPKTLGNIPNCSFSWYFQPSGRVGGDMFDVFMLNDDHMGLYMIDVMGHGVVSSMLAVALSEFFILDVDRDSPLKKKTNSEPYYKITSPVKVIEYLNRRFTFDKYNLYFTIFYMVLNTNTGILRYVRAGHPPPILVKNDENIIELSGYGTPIGFELNVEYEEIEVQLKPKETVIVYTDGLTEIEDEDGNKLDYDGVKNYVKKELQFSKHHLTSGLKKMARDQYILKDDISILEFKWEKQLGGSLIAREKISNR
ncbi:MAG: histidine kinase [Alkaliphilus sp.]|nr:MAG: histidine kinase [Alkaliphilus sp.]